MCRLSPYSYTASLSNFKQPAAIAVTVPLLVTLQLQIVMMGDHVITEHNIKLVWMVVTGVIVLLVMVVFKYQKRAEKLKKKALQLLSGEVTL